MESPLRTLLLAETQFTIPIMPHYAHSLKHDPNTNKWEKLADHLQAVAGRARTLAESATNLGSSLAIAAEVAGLLHDLGKYRPEWQAYLNASAAGQDPPSVPHAIHGAAYAEHLLNNTLLAMVIAGHHSGLHDLVSLAQTLANEEQTHRAICEQIVPIAQSEAPSFPTTALPSPFDGDDELTYRRFEFWTRVLFSVLIDADRLETERFYSGGRPSGPRLDCGGLVVVLLAKLHEAKSNKAAKASGGNTNPKLLALRNDIYESCLTAASQTRGFFELTVPTGGGKTLSGMAFALKHAERHGLRRVIVVIPYLSIIEQNAQEYRTVLGSENVVEHHSAVAEQEAKKVSGESPRRTFAELATENWDAPVIVTTSVQFLETLLESSPRRCRKLHNVARSVVLFDEAQSLPTHILNPLVSVFRELVDSFGCSVVFSTATQPAFRVGTGLTEGLNPDELKPILPPELVTESFLSLQRVDYNPELSTAWDWDTLVGRLTGLSGERYSQGLCVLNTRKHAREVWEKLRKKATDEDAVVHLSSAMCAEHRLAVLGDPEKPAPGSVRHRLRHGLPCWLVSTQVIEAGVDVDFPRVFRALGPLDAIVQVAGRCNREGGLKDAAGNPTRGKVVIFQPADEGMPRGLYQTATGKARTFLGEFTSEDLATKPEVFVRYFSELYGVANCDAHGIQSKRKDFQFREVAEKARVINDGGTPVIVSYGASPGLIATIRSAGRFDRSVLRKLQRFAVNLRYADWAELEQRTMIEPLLASCPDGPHVLHTAAYHNELGVVIADRPPEDFII